MPTMGARKPATASWDGLNIANASRAGRKRKLGVLVACDACRRRKTACDGARPVCGSCLERNEYHCKYDTSNSAETRFTALKRESEALKLRNTDLEREVEALRTTLAMRDGASHQLQCMPTSDPMHSFDHAEVGSSMLAFGTNGDDYTHFRLSERSMPYGPTFGSLGGLSDEPVNFMATYPLATPVQSGYQSTPFQQPIHTPSHGPGSLVQNSQMWDAIDPNLACVSRDPRTSTPANGTAKIPHGESDVFQVVSSSNKSIDMSDEHDHAAPSAPSPTYEELLKRIDIDYWSAVPVTSHFAAATMSSFLMTQHPILGFFDAGPFLADLVAKQHTHCSSLLVNAILYIACLEQTTLHSEASFLKKSFLAEAERLWHLETWRASLPTLSALNLLGFGCICDGDSEKGDRYFLHSRSIADDLDLFAGCNADGQPKIAKGLRKARAHAAWGMFAFHTMTSFYFRQGVPRSAPSMDIPEGEGPLNSSTPTGAGKVFKMWCGLWRTMHPIAQVFCNSDSHSSAKNSLALAEWTYSQLLELARNMSPFLARNALYSHQMMVFHMYFHAAVMDLFRPFLGERLCLGTFIASNTSPEAIYSDALNELKRLAWTYRASYPEAKSTFEWNHACFYIASAVIHDPGDDWRACFELCLQSYVVLSKSYGSAWHFICGLVALAVKIRHLPISEASRYLEEAGSWEEIPRNVRCLRVAIDQRLALTCLKGARMDALMEDFTEYGAMDEFVDLSRLA